MIASVARMIGAAAKEAAMLHPLTCDKCHQSGMFDCPEMLRLVHVAVRLDRLRERPKRCEWNPTAGEAARVDFVGRDEHVVYGEGTCPNDAVVSLGETFWICAECAKLPKFYGRPVRDLTGSERRGFTNPPAYTGV